MRRLLAFPAGGYDDQVDSFCMGILASKKKGVGGLMDTVEGGNTRNWRRMANI